ncbi:MAG: DUF1844 domain-containing protein [Deltaproteobacteria bacterium]|nr:DUF1844 domain-containing protein [Deltaproteobacteria bacterium]
MTQDNQEKKNTDQQVKESPIEITFSTFLLSLSSSAMMSLGIIPNPITNETTKDTTSARQTIDLIKIFEEKTKGNLSEDEEKLIEAILHELHTAYLKVVE